MILRETKGPRERANEGSGVMAKANQISSAEGRIILISTRRRDSRGDIGRLSYYFIGNGSADCYSVVTISERDIISRTTVILTHFYQSSQRWIIIRTRSHCGRSERSTAECGPASRDCRLLATSAGAYTATAPPQLVRFNRTVCSVVVMAANAAHLLVRARIIFGFAQHRRDVSAAVGGITRICRTFDVSVWLGKDEINKKKK